MEDVMMVPSPEIGKNMMTQDHAVMEQKMEMAHIKMVSEMVGEREKMMQASKPQCDY